MFTPNTKLNKIMMIMSYSIVSAVYSIKLKMDGGQFDSLSQPKPVSIGNHLKKIKLVLEPIKDANKTLTPGPKDSDSNKPNSTPSEPETGSDFGSEPPSEDIPTRPGSADSNNNNIDNSTFKSVKFTSDSVNRDASMSPPPTCTLPINETISGQERSVSTACPSTSDSQSPVRSRRGSNFTNASSTDNFDNRSEMSSPSPGEPTTAAFPEQTLPSGSNMSSTDQSQASKVDDVKDDTKMSISEFLKKKVNVNPTSEFNVNNNTVEIEKSVWKDIKKALEDSAIPNELDFETEESPMIKMWKKEISTCTGKMEQSGEVSDETRMSKNDFMEKRCFNRDFKEKYEAVFDKMSLPNIPKQKAVGESTTDVSEATSSEANILLDNSTNSDVGFSLGNRFAAETKSNLKKPDPAVTLVGEAEIQTLPNAVGDAAPKRNGQSINDRKPRGLSLNLNSIVNGTTVTTISNNSNTTSRSQCHASGSTPKCDEGECLTPSDSENDETSDSESDDEETRKNKKLFNDNYDKNRNGIILVMKFVLKRSKEQIAESALTDESKKARHRLSEVLDKLPCQPDKSFSSGDLYLMLKSLNLQFQDVQKFYNLVEFERIVENPETDEKTLQRLSHEIANRLSDQPIFKFGETRKGVKGYFKANYSNDVIRINRLNPSPISNSKAVFPLYTGGNSLDDIVKALGEFEVKKVRMETQGANGSFNALRHKLENDTKEDIYLKTVANRSNLNDEQFKFAQRNIYNEINIYKKLSAKKFTKSEFQIALEKLKKLDSDPNWVSVRQKTWEFAKDIAIGDVGLSISDFVRDLCKNDKISMQDSNKWLKMLGNILNPYFPTVFFAGIFNKRAGPTGAIHIENDENFSLAKGDSTGVIGMEKLYMMNLKRYLKKNKGNIDTIENMRKRRKIAKNLMHALAQLHSEYGIAHRDLKKENLMVCTETGNVKILDFGMAKDKLWIPSTELVEIENDKMLAINHNNDRLYNLANHDIDLMLIIIQEVLNISDFELTTGIFDKDNQLKLRYHPIIYFLLRFPGRSQFLNEFRPSAKVIANLLDVLLPDDNSDKLSEQVEDLDFNKNIDVDALTWAVQDMTNDLRENFAKIFLKELKLENSSQRIETNFLIKRKMISIDEIYQLHLIIDFLNFLVSDAKGVLSKSQFGCNDKLLNELKEMKTNFDIWYEIAEASYTKNNPGTDLNKMIEDYEEN